MRHFNYEETKKFLNKKLELEADFNWIKSHSIFDQLQILGWIINDRCVGSKYRLLELFRREMILIGEENGIGSVDFNSLKRIEKKLIEIRREENLNTLLND